MVCVTTPRLRRRREMKKVLSLLSMILITGVFAQETPNPEIEIQFSTSREFLTSSSSDTKLLKNKLFAYRNELCVNEVLSAAQKLAGSAGIADLVSKGHKVVVRPFFSLSDNSFVGVQLLLSSDELPSHSVYKQSRTDDCSTVAENLNNFDDIIAAAVEDYEEFNQFKHLFDELSGGQATTSANPAEIGDMDRNLPYGYSSYGAGGQVGTSFGSFAWGF